MSMLNDTGTDRYSIAFFHSPNVDRGWGRR
jgi:isopenicillin N synthase-like dioxygenase